MACMSKLFSHWLETALGRRAITSYIAPAACIANRFVLMWLIYQLSLNKPNIQFQLASRLWLESNDLLHLSRGRGTRRVYHRRWESESECCVHICTDKLDLGIKCSRLWNNMYKRARCEYRLPLTIFTLHLLIEIDLLQMDSILSLYISTFFKPIKMKYMARLHFVEEGGWFYYLWCEERGARLFPKEHSVQGPLAALGLIVGPVWNPNWLIQDRARITPLSSLNSVLSNNGLPVTTVKWVVS